MKNQNNHMTNQIVAKTRMGVKIRGQNPWLCKVKPTLTALHDLYATKVSAITECSN